MGLSCVNTDPKQRWMWDRLGCSPTDEVMEAAACCCSASQSTAAAILIPGSNKQAEKSDRDQTQNNAAQQRFDHGVASFNGISHNSSTVIPR